MIKAGWHQIRTSLVSFAYTAVMPVMALLSSAWRRRNHHAYLVLTNPFWDRPLQLSAMLSDPLAVMLVPVRSAAHNTTELELLSLGAVVSQMKATRVFEIGTFDGRTTRTLAANLGPGGHVWTINLPPGQATNDGGEANVDSQLNLKVASGFRFAGTPEAQHITQLFGDSANYDFSPHHGTMDMVFIDGSHTEAYVANDTQVALRLLSPSGGLIVWHDALYYGVVEYLKQRIKDGWPVQWIEGTTLAVGYARAGKLVPVPCPLPQQESASA